MHLCACGGGQREAYASQPTEQMTVWFFCLQFGKWNISVWKMKYKWMEVKLWFGAGMLPCHWVIYFTHEASSLRLGDKQNGSQVPKLSSYHQRAGLLFKIFLKMYFGFFHYISLQHILTNMELNILNIN